MYNRPNFDLLKEDFMSEPKIMANEQNDEIDLIDLIRALWDKKLWIVLSTFVCTLLAGIYAFTAKEQWTSRAVVIAPQTTELAKTLPVRAEYARITENTEFSATGLANSLYEEFSHYLRSNELKRAFLEQSEIVKEYTKEMNEKQKREYISKVISEFLTLSQHDNKKKSGSELDGIGLILSFSGETPEYSQSVLSEYVNFVNDYALKQNDREFKVNFNLLLDSLNFNKTQIEANLNEVKAVQVENLSNALATAKKAGVSEFAQRDSLKVAVPEYLLGDGKLNISDSKIADGTYLFMLGEKYLQAQLDVAKNASVVYPPEYHKINRKLSQLQSLVGKIDNLDGEKAYHYLSDPDYPVNKDKPKRLILLIIGAFLGVILGMIISLANCFLLRKH